MDRRASVAAIDWLGASEGDVRLIGGKAVSLNRLAGHGFPVPPGFCVTTQAFDVHLATVPGAAAHLAALPAEAARLRLTGALDASSLGPDLRRHIDAAVARLVADTAWGDEGSPRFAVRSSGVGEDGATASHAGLHETELGVPPDGVEAAIRRCWASLWSGAALAYRLRHGLPLDGGAMAVVVQALVPADASAVVFTRHPVTGSDELVVTAVRGLGDAMVSGTVTPETIAVDRGSLEIVDYAPGDGPAALDAVAVTQLVELSLEVERAFGYAVDIEAARAADRWYLLQARPITTFEVPL